MYAQWRRENKPHGFEVQDLRLGGLMQRLKTARRTLLRHLDGDTESIPELEEERLPRKDVSKCPLMSLEFRFKLC